MIDFSVPIHIVSYYYPTKTVGLPTAIISPQDVSPSLSAGVSLYHNSVPSNPFAAIIAG